MCYFKIEREFGDPDEVNFALRFINQSLQNKDFIENELILNQISFEIHDTKEFGFVIVIDLNQKIEIGLIQKVIKNLKIEEKDFGIFATILSFNDQSGFSFPPKIRELIGIIGGNIDISIITLS